MGAYVESRIAAFQEQTGIEPVRGERGEVLKRMRDDACQLLEVLTLEQAGIRGGDGYWYGSDPVMGYACDLYELAIKYRKLDERDTLADPVTGPTDKACG